MKELVKFGNLSSRKFYYIKNIYEFQSTIFSEDDSETLFFRSVDIFNFEMLSEYFKLFVDRYNPKKQN